MRAPRSPAELASDSVSLADATCSFKESVTNFYLQSFMAAEDGSTLYLMWGDDPQGAMLPALLPNVAAMLLALASRPMPALLADAMVP